MIFLGLFNLVMVFVALRMAKKQYDEKKYRISLEKDPNIRAAMNKSLKAKTMTSWFLGAIFFIIMVFLMIEYM